MNGSTDDQGIMASYIRIGSKLIKQLHAMTEGEREGLVKEFQGIEETMTCLGLKRILETPGEQT